MSSCVHTDYKKKYILILGRCPTQGLNDAMLTPKDQYSINFSRSNRKFRLSLHYNGNNSFLFVNTRKYISSNQMILKEKNMSCVQEILQRISQVRTWTESRVKLMFLQILSWL